MIRRKPFDDDDENPDRWLVSYADFITLLFAFFVVMYSISSVNKGKYNQLTSSMGTAFTGINPAQHLKNNNSAADSKLKGQSKSLIKPLPLTHLYNEKMRREMLLNAWVSIAGGDHPRIVEERLLAYLR